jgi:4-amino-4-deoxy-L-arabinose transferase-like glycosyltransferase
VTFLLPATLRGQPRWVLPTLAGILALAALLYLWNIGHSGLSTYYAAAARSMSRNLHALAFGALDPAATTTLDKLSGFVVPQALFIRLLGFHGWVLALPQAIEGILTVFASYVVGTRWRGPVMGIATAGIMALTPMLAAMFGRPTEDSMLTMTMVFAFAAWQRAVQSRHWPWLLLAAAWVAVGFQAKMLQAWLILPALAVGYFVAVHGTVRIRMLRVGIAGVVAILLSLSWIGVIQATPPQDRPYVDGSTNNNAFSMVFGYNGVDRIVPGLIPGSVPQVRHTSSRGNTTATGWAAHNPAKLVLPQFTTQIGWLYPAAIAGVLLGLRPLFRRRFRRGNTSESAGTDEARTVEARTAENGTVETGTVRTGADRAETGTVITLALSAGVTALVLSLAFVPHATYFAGLALPLALLSVLGALEVTRIYRLGAPRSHVPLVALVAAQTAWATAIALIGPASLRWVALPVLLLGVTATVGLLVRRTGRAWLLPAVAAALIGPTIWSASVLKPGGGGSVSDGYAGPRVSAAFIMHHAPRARAAPSSPVVPGLDAEQVRLLRYIAPLNGGRPWLFATDTTYVAVNFLLYTPYQVTLMGGFSRQAPHPTLAQLRAELRASTVKFVLLSDAPGPSNTALASVHSWVASTCVVALRGQFRDGSPASQTLYDCAPGS